MFSRLARFKVTKTFLLKFNAAKLTTKIRISATAPDLWSKGIARRRRPR